MPINSDLAETSESLALREGSSDDTIVVVGMQKGFITEYNQHLPAAIATFLESKKFQHHIFTRFRNPGKGGFYEKHLNWLRLQEPSEIEIVPELASYPSLLIDKCTYSGFSTGELEAHIQANNITKVYVCGSDTNVCVTSMAGELFDRRVHPVVISDLCANYSATDYHEMSLKNLAKWIGRKNILTSEEILSRGTEPDQKLASA